jgi:hypothetical protein
MKCNSKQERERERESERDALKVQATSWQNVYNFRTMENLWAETNYLREIPWVTFVLAFWSRRVTRVHKGMKEREKE